MNTLIGMTVRACVMGIDATEDDDRRGRAKYLAILENLAGELDRGDQAFAHPGAEAPVVVPAAEMHQSERDMLCEAGFVDVGELLSAYKTLVQSDQATRQRMATLVNENAVLTSVAKPWTDAQVARLYDNSPEFVGAEAADLSRNEFKRLVRHIERAHGILTE